MSNILSEKIINRSKGSNKVSVYKLANDLGHTRHFPPANKEWRDSVYAYNKNYTKSLPVYNNTVTDLITSYFNAYHVKKERQMESKMSRRMRIRLIRLSVNKAFVNKAELKHTNSKITVTSNIYNARKIFLLDTLRKKDPSLNCLRNMTALDQIKTEQKYITNMAALKQTKANQKQNYIRQQKIKSFLRTTGVNVKNLSVKIKTWQDMLSKLEQFTHKVESNIGQEIPKNYILKDDLTLKTENLVFSNNKKVFSVSEASYMYLEKIKMLLVKKILIKHNLYRMVKHLRQIEDLYLFQLSKFSFNNKDLLKQLVNKIYARKTEFNFIDLKHFYLNSDILAQTVCLKLKNRADNTLRVLKSPFMKLKLPLAEKFNNFSYTSYRTLFYNKVNSYNLNSLFYPKVYYDKDVLSNSLQEIYEKKIDNKNYIFNTMQYKTVNGIKLEASGRLTKRFTASRSVSKVKSIGSLKNLYSSYKGLSSVVLRGHARSNIQYAKQSSKNRNGAYGLKVLISSK